MISHDSPSLVQIGRAAHEVKFILSEAQAAPVLGWAEANMVGDPHGNPDYLTTTIYLDTPELATFRREAGFTSEKLRIRRYSAENLVFLERKIKQGTRVRKHRVSVPLEYLDRLLEPCPGLHSAADWFSELRRSRGVTPQLVGSYRRRAFSGQSEVGATRLTLDHGLRFARNVSLSFPEKAGSAELNDAHHILELKYVDGLPAQFRELLAELNLQPTTFSKYRQGMKRVLEDVDAGVA